jgi:hypothetical protein
MMKRVTATTLLAALMLLAASCSQSDRPTVLKFHFEPGLQLTYVQHATGHTRVVQGDSVTRNSSDQVSAEVIQTVKRVLGDGTAQVEEVDRWFGSSATKTDSGGVDTTSQSRTFSLYMTPNGKIVDLVFESSVDSTQASYLRHFFDQNNVVFPDTAVRPGGSWTQKSSVTVDGSTMDASTTYRVLGYTEEAGYDCIQIGYDGTLIIPIVASPTDSTQRHGVDRFTISGTMNHAYEPGLVVSIKEKSQMNGQREKTLAGKIVKSTVSIDMEVSYVLKERKNAGETAR